MLIELAKWHTKQLSGSEICWKIAIFVKTHREKHLFHKFEAEFSVVCRLLIMSVKLKDDFCIDFNSIFRIFRL